MPTGTVLGGDDEVVELAELLIHVSLLSILRFRGVSFLVVLANLLLELSNFLEKLGHLLVLGIGGNGLG